MGGEDGEGGRKDGRRGAEKENENEEEEAEEQGAGWL